MIIAHHAGEEFLRALIAGGASAVAMLVLAWRVWLNNLVDRLRRR